MDLWKTMTSMWCHWVGKSRVDHEYREISLSQKFVCIIMLFPSFQDSHVPNGVVPHHYSLLYLFHWNTDRTTGMTSIT